MWVLWWTYSTLGTCGCYGGLTVLWGHVGVMVDFGDTWVLWWTSCGAGGCYGGLTLGTCGCYGGLYVGAGGCYGGLHVGLVGVMVEFGDTWV